MWSVLFLIVNLLWRGSKLHIRKKFPRFTDWSLNSIELFLLVPKWNRLRDALEQKLMRGNKSLKTFPCLRVKTLLCIITLDQNCICRLFLDAEVKCLVGKLVKIPRFIRLNIAHYCFKICLFPLDRYITIASRSLTATYTNMYLASREWGVHGLAKPGGASQVVECTCVFASLDQRQI